MFTPMQWKRIIHGLVQCVVGMVTEMVQSIVVAIDDTELVRNVGYLSWFNRLTVSATASELFNLA